MVPPRVIRRLVLAPLVIVMAVGLVVLSPLIGLVALLSALLADPAVTGFMASNQCESFRQGARGPTLDALLIYREWGFKPEQIRVPVHFFHGTADPTVPFAFSRYLAHKVPGATLYLQAAQDLRVLGGVADPRCQIHERQLHRPLQAETRRCATESRSTAPSTRRSNLCTLTRGRLRVHRVKDEIGSALLGLGAVACRCLGDWREIVPRQSGDRQPRTQSRRIACRARAAGPSNGQMAPPETVRIGLR